MSVSVIGKLVSCLFCLQVQLKGEIPFPYLLLNGILQQWKTPSQKNVQGCFFPLVRRNLIQFPSSQCYSLSFKLHNVSRKSKVCLLYYTSRLRWLVFPRLTLSKFSNVNVAFTVAKCTRWARDNFLSSRCFKIFKKVGQNLKCFKKIGQIRKTCRNEKHYSVFNSSFFFHFQVLWAAVFSFAKGFGACTACTCTSITQYQLIGLCCLWSIGSVNFAIYCSSFNQLVLLTIDWASPQWLRLWQWKNKRAGCIWYDDSSLLCTCATLV